MSVGRRHHPHTGGLMASELDHTAVLMVCGSGGVGKTSVAAAVATAEAMRGRRVCVLTIDPARRLADAMGISAIDDRERMVALPDGAATGGELWALMLDPKRAFDRLVTETATSDEERDRVLSNRVYQQVSQSTAGVQEYMALERLYELDRGGRYDLIVVDTPPTAHARDLLESPRRMLGFLEGRSLRWFIKPGARIGRIGLRAIGGPGGAIIGVLTRITGTEMLKDTSEFFESMDGMYDHIRERIRVVDQLFADARTGFLVVTSPQRESMESATDFVALLDEQDLRLSGIIVNRVEPCEADVELAGEGELAALAGVSQDLAARIAAAQADRLTIAARDHAEIAGLRDQFGDETVIVVPRRPRMLAEIAALAELSEHLYA